ncbi:CDC27 family protein [Falsiporphyromonas endometrii]|uniref:CDC27 family protein n=1 Tax=Falsiporphyromonas endometrii TaxID=1387297 RepID=A0ABV9K7U2_9PORP
MRGFLNTLYVVCALLLVAGFGANQLQAQTLAETKSYYEKGEYAKALPGLQRLVENNPKNQTYALWYGKALNNLGQYEKAVHPLRVAAKKAGEAQFLYAQALYFTYDFDKAKDVMEEYMSYLKRTKRQMSEAESFDKKIVLAKSMLDRVARVEVIDSIVLPKDLFLTPYHSIASDNGEVCWTSAIFPDQSKIDTSAFAGVTSYTNGLGNRRIVALRDEKHNMALYGSSVVGSRWSTPDPLDKLINLTGTENYPFLKQDGSTLLFSRKSEDGIGGYDLYMTRRNAQGDFLEPTMLGMPFNSPYNDYMLAYDENNGIGYFTSDRFQSKGNVCVYTFIIDEDNTLLPSDDVEEKTAWASLKSIKVTQDKNSDYSDIKRRVGRKDKSNDKMSDAILLSVNGKLYTDWSDFTSSKARDLYRVILDKRYDLSKLNATLETLRRAYRDASSSEKSALKGKILNLEENQKSLRQMINDMVQKCIKQELTK